MCHFTDQAVDLLHLRGPTRHITCPSHSGSPYSTNSHWLWYVFFIYSLYTPLKVDHWDQNKHNQKFSCSFSGVQSWWHYFVLWSCYMQGTGTYTLETGKNKRGNMFPWFWGLLPCLTARWHQKQWDCCAVISSRGDTRRSEHHSADVYH